MRSYIIVLKSGKAINIRADSVHCDKTSQMLKLYNGISMVASLNMNNIVGWIEGDYMVERVVLKK